MSEGEVDPSGFLTMCESLAHVAATTYERSLVSQVGAVLKNCLAHTSVASAENIKLMVKKRLGYVEFSDGTVIAQWRKAGDAEMFLSPSTFPKYQNRWPKKTPKPAMKGGMSWHQMNDPQRRWADTRWADFQRKDSRLEKQAEKNRRSDLKKALAARGLAKQSWLQIAESLGLTAEQIGAAAYVLRAKPSNGKTYQNGTSSKMGGTDEIVIEIENSSNLLTHFSRPSGWDILQQAMDARVSAFERDLANDVFNDMENRMKRYPGIYIDS